MAKHRGAGLAISEKPDTSLVTAADLASERLILDRIRRQYPADQIYSEEAGLSSPDRQAGTHIWIVDPLDGTTNFANGYPFYCVSIGRGRFRADGSVEMVAGAVLDAARDRLYYAELGKGAAVDGQPLRIAAPRDFAKCFLVTGFYYWKDESLKHEIDRFARIASRCQSIRRDGAAALDLALVAEGVFDAFWEVGLQPWDVAAGSLLVSEAGGQVANYPPRSPLGKGATSGGGVYSIEGVGTVAGAPRAVATILSML